MTWFAFTFYLVGHRLWSRRGWWFAATTHRCASVRLLWFGFEVQANPMFLQEDRK